MCNSATARQEAIGDGGARVADALAVREEELTREVPLLLEALNHASSQINHFEQKAGEAQARYKQRLEHWSRLYRDLRSTHGTNFDRVKPYFEAALALNAASERMQKVVCEFSSVAARCTQVKSDLRAMEKRLDEGLRKGTVDLDLQKSLSRAAALLLHYQQERDWRQEEHEQALRSFQEAQDAFKACGAQLADSTVKGTFPCFRLLRQHQLKLASEQRRINTFVENAQAAKTAYSRSLHELERISTAVHNVRREDTQPKAATSEQGVEQVFETPPAVPIEAGGG